MYVLLLQDYFDVITTHYLSSGSPRIAREVTRCPINIEDTVVDLKSGEFATKGLNALLKQERGICVTTAQVRGDSPQATVLKLSQN